MEIIFKIWQFKKHKFISTHKQINSKPYFKINNSQAQTAILTKIIRKRTFKISPDNLMICWKVLRKWDYIQLQALKIKRTRHQTENLKFHKVVSLQSPTKVKLQAAIILQNPNYKAIPLLVVKNSNRYL
jgi:hypothetical protein